jgi:hypothetical protein
LTFRTKALPGNYDYVVNPQLPEYPARAASRVGVTRLRIVWKDLNNQSVLESTGSTRLPYVMNDAVAETSVPAPASPGRYRVEVSVIESTPITVSTEGVLN